VTQLWTTQLGVAAQGQLQTSLGPKMQTFPNHLSNVVPFVCADPTICLDGISASPSLGTCVALGKFNLTTTEVPSQGYLLTTPSGVIFFNETSTAWFLKAVLFGRKCLDLQYSTEVSAISKNLQSICDLYSDTTGLNKCKTLQMDKRYLD